MARYLIYAALAMLFWGTAPILGKLGLVQVSPYVGLVIRTAVVMVTLVVYGIASGQLAGVTRVDPASLRYLAGEGLLASLLGHLAYFYALKHGPASRVVPFIAAYPLVTFSLALALLAERVTAGKALGAVLVAAGLLLLLR